MAGAAELAADAALPWTSVPVVVTTPLADDVLERRCFVVRLAALEREGPCSYFAAHRRFSPGAAVDLGRLARPACLALERYLLGGELAAAPAELAALEYVADVFGLARLAGLLPHLEAAGHQLAAMRCLNCHVYVPARLRHEPCSFKPPCSHGTHGLPCLCRAALSTHVFLQDAWDEAAGRRAGGVRP